MDNKWNIAEKPGVYEKCCKMENIIRNIFKNPKAWPNGFIQLVDGEEKWYHHRETHIFIPTAQSDIEQTYDNKPETGVITLKSGEIHWDYMTEEEALKIIPGFIAFNPKTPNGIDLSEVCQNNVIFLKDGKVYDAKSNTVRSAQENEQGKVLQICHLDNAYECNDIASWYYDIYLWAKLGAIPSVLRTLKGCWSIMQFLIDNFNHIDFTEFILKGEGNRIAEVKEETTPEVIVEEVTPVASVVETPVASVAETAPVIETPVASVAETAPVVETPVASVAKTTPVVETPVASVAETTPEPSVIQNEEINKADLMAKLEQVINAQPITTQNGVMNVATDMTETFASTTEEQQPEQPETLYEQQSEQVEQYDTESAEVDNTEQYNQTQQQMYTDETEQQTGEYSKIQELLNCDKDRCRLEPYDKDILYDIIRGHWELFDEEVEQGLVQPDNKEFVSRNPKLDIKQGVIGIDFGTKSTVVVKQDTTNRIIPVRIGTGDLSSEVKEEDFENPSIVEFTNVEKFLEDYQKEIGRPHTSCNDIFVSYDAYQDFQNCKPYDFYAYFSDLKQWANGEKGDVVIKDKQRKEYHLGADMDEMSEIVNPLELYAYYIGLYINNMRNGIYLKYLMSFPVGYAKETRDLIAKSFYEGIKKSLPTSILNDTECMNQFSVELGISEPAAYAVTALEQSNLEPKDETERLMYGIFDFGGGTTDFDFGICRGTTDEEYEREGYDYILECFGADSDVTLGGENMLELIAYKVYQKNLDIFREKKVTFTLPMGENPFPGSEMLLVNSQISRRNMAILKEELRPLWHQEQGWRKKYQLENESQNDVDKEGIVVSLYNIDGELIPQCVLEFSSQELIEIIKNRIQKGIESFFQCLIKIFLYDSELLEKDKEETVYIFLSGNSSKSEFVKELFQKKIEEYYSRSKKLSEKLASVHFELIDPLTGENENHDKYVPNAKTGVAYGLLKSREGSSIKIVKNYEADSLQQSRFHYYLGRDRRHHFDCRFSPAEIPYNKWIPFQGATKNIIRIYYTNNPMADSKMEQMPIDNVPYKEIGIDIAEDAYLFIRTVEPDMLEYAVAKGIEEIADEDVKQCYFN
ncbi:MAG: hypothetical protein HFE57_05510 [Firmicutes bacterium]|nr:hypothetical protein [Bacillota bacterium]